MERGEWDEESAKRRREARAYWDYYHAESGWSRSWREWGKKTHNVYLLFALWALSALLSWATVNAVHYGGEKPGGGGYSKGENHEPMRKGGRQ